MGFGLAVHGGRVEVGEEGRGEEVLCAGGESVEEGVGVRPQGSVVRPSAQDGVRLWRGFDVGREE